MTNEKKTDPRGTYEKFDLSDLEFQAACSQVQQWTRDLRDQDDPRLNGSSVAIRVGARHFLVTAGHVISSSHELEIVRREGENPVPHQFRNRFWDDSGKDVGALELSDEQVATIRHFAPEESIITALDQSKEWGVIVSGFPSERHVTDEYGGLVSLGASCYSLTLPADEWPSGLERLPVVGYDVFVRYPQSAVAYPNGLDVPRPREELERVKTPQPHGLSGCGIWLIHFCEKRKTKILFPSMKLIAVQTHYLPGIRLLRGVLIGHCLDLIRRTYPDIEAHFAGKRRT